MKFEECKVGDLVKANSNEIRGDYVNGFTKKPYTRTQTFQNSRT